MSDDLEIKKEGQEVTDADLEEAVVEFTTTSEYIQAACSALAAVEELDTGMMSNEDQKRVKRIKRKSLKIIDNCITELYDELYDNDDDD